MACTNIAAKATFGIWKHVSLEKLMTTSDQFQQVYGDLKPVTMFQIKSCIVFFGGGNLYKSGTNYDEAALGTELSKVPCRFSTCNSPV